MANSRIMLVCKHCGENFCIGKGYFGSYSTSNDELHKQLNIFYGEHEHGCCSEDIDCSDNARNHFAILEEGEDLGVLAADVVPKSEVERLTVELDAMRGAANSYKMHYENAKAEIVREIFEEIEKLIYRRMIPDITLIDDRLITDIAELKKKRTEQKNG